MRCPRCDADTPEGGKFCIECGTPLRARRPQCGADVLPRAKFCAECGTPLTAQSPALPAVPAPSPLSYTPGHLAEKILTSKTALEGERKQVTVLFADLKDSTELIRGLDPEAAQQLLDPAIHIMMDAVHRFEGTVNQVLGDGIMALALRLLGEIAAQRQPLEVEPAADYYHQALALAEELDMRPLQAHCHRGLGTLYATTGQREKARAELSTAIELYRAMDMTFWLPEAEATLADAE
jgi:tetratricopeptide (TPR) repeat protein